MADATPAWHVEIAADESEAVKRQRAAGFDLASRIEAGEVLAGLSAKFAACVIAGIGANPPQGKGRPRKDAAALVAEFTAGCEVAARKVLVGEALGAVDREMAALALRTFARGLKEPPKARGGQAKLPDDTAILVEAAPLAGRSKRATKADTAAREDVDESTVTREVAKGRENARAFLDWLKK